MYLPYISVSALLGEGCNSPSQRGLTQAVGPSLLPAENNLGAPVQAGLRLHLARPVASHPQPCSLLGAFLLVDASHPP